MSKIKGLSMGMSLMCLWKKGDHTIMCSYKKESGKRQDQVADNTEPIGNNKECWFNGKPPENCRYKKKCSGYQSE